MDRLKDSIIAPHDRNILALKKYKRINPIFDPPLILELNEEFDMKDFQKGLSMSKIV